MKLSLIFFGVLFVSVSYALPKASPGIGTQIKDKIGDALSKNVEKMCIGTGGGLTIDSCPKPFQYCDTMATLGTRCRWTAGSWFLFIGVPIIAVIIIIGVVLYMKKR